MKLQIITPSHINDIERCKFLCKSVDQFVDQSIEHLLLIDRRDLSAFAELSGPRRTIIITEEVLPRWLKRLPGSNKWWLNLRGGIPVRNWILQQILKLSLPTYSDADVAIYVDSDVTFIRKFGPDQVIDDRGVRLFQRPGKGMTPQHLRWHKSARRLLRLEKGGYLGSCYIGNLVTWRRENVLALQEFIGKLRGRPWQAEIAGTLHFSEYILYGAFCEFVMGEFSGHYYASEDLCHCSWDYKELTEDSIEEFLGQVTAQHAAVLIQSNLGIPSNRYEAAIERLTERLRIESPNTEVV